MSEKALGNTFKHVLLQLLNIETYPEDFRELHKASNNPIAF
mgnify:CR=1 FL=1|jgi:hypothetical protein